MELLFILFSVNSYYFRLIYGLSANSWPYRLINNLFNEFFESPLYDTDSHPCIRKGGPVDCTGGPVGLQTCNVNDKRHHVLTLLEMLKVTWQWGASPFGRVVLIGGADPRATQPENPTLAHLAQ